MTVSAAERLFSGPLSAEYHTLELICPAAAAMSLRVAEHVAGLPLKGTPPASLLEIGCGTGITTRALLGARPDCRITAIDNEPAMVAQAQANLSRWAGEGRVRFVEADALSWLRGLPGGSVDVVASSYAVHNFLQDYRRDVLREIFRVLKPGGAFVNGDRYGLDDTLAHTRLIQEEIRQYFKALGSLGRIGTLEEWIVHLFSDESPDRIMRFSPALAAMRAAGFDPVEVRYRDGVNTLAVATKP